MCAPSTSASGGEQKEKGSGIMADWRKRVVCGADDPGWLVHRRSRFTGSDAAALMGEHEYTDLAVVLDEKRTGESGFNAEQDHVIQGQLAEPFVAAYYARATGCELEQVGQLIAHPECPYLAATPDYITTNGMRNVQIKWTLASPKSWQRMLPRYIWWQVQLENAVLGVPNGRVVAYHRRNVPPFGSSAIGDQVFAYEVTPDPSAMARLVDKANELGPQLWGQR